MSTTRTLSASSSGFRPVFVASVSVLVDESTPQAKPTRSGSLQPERVSTPSEPQMKLASMTVRREALECGAKEVHTTRCATRALASGTRDCTNHSAPIARTAAARSSVLGSDRSSPENCLQKADAMADQELCGKITRRPCPDGGDGDESTYRERRGNGEKREGRGGITARQHEHEIDTEDDSAHAREGVFAVQRRHRGSSQRIFRCCICLRTFFFCIFLR